MEAQKVQIVQPSTRNQCSAVSRKECKNIEWDEGENSEEKSNFQLQNDSVFRCKSLPSDSKLGLQPTHDGYEDEDSQSTDEGPQWIETGPKNNP